VADAFDALEDDGALAGALCVALELLLLPQPAAIAATANAAALTRSFVVIALAIICLLPHGLVGP
jgi:hypothetical protein